MKKTLYIVFLIICTTIYSACTSSQPKPEELVGKHTFELLQNMQNISQKEFSNYFISLEELREFVKDTTIDTNFKNAITKVSKEKYQTGMKQAFQMIQESGKRYQIDWKTITFKEYVYQTRADSGILFHDGYVVFVNDGKEYVSKIISFPYKNEQLLFTLANFEPVRQ